MQKICNSRKHNRRWSIGILTLFLWGTVSFGPFQHSHNTRGLLQLSRQTETIATVQRYSTALVGWWTLSTVRHRSGRFVYQELSATNGSPPSSCPNIQSGVKANSIRFFPRRLLKFPIYSSSYSSSVEGISSQVCRDFFSRYKPGILLRFKTI
jgi:hypothetical protein